MKRTEAIASTLRDALVLRGHRATVVYGGTDLSPTHSVRTPVGTLLVTDTAPRLKTDPRLAVSTIDAMSPGSIHLLANVLDIVSTEVRSWVKAWDYVFDGMNRDTFDRGEVTDERIIRDTKWEREFWMRKAADHRATVHGPVTPVAYDYEVVRHGAAVQS